MEFDAVSREGRRVVQQRAVVRRAALAQPIVRIARAVLRDPFPTHPAEFADPARTPNPEHQDD
jgi:hypothetical protein